MSKLAAFLLLVSYASADDAVRQADKQVAHAVERLRAELEEWGSIDVSEPLIYPVNNQFNLGDPADFAKTSNYITAEQTEVSAAVGQLTQSILSTIFNGSIGFPQLSAPAAGTTTPNGSALTPPAQAAPADAPPSQAKNFLAKPTFEALGGLLGSASPTGISMRQSILLGAGDKITEILTRTMANPPAPEGTKLYLAIFQVTCNPGWRTLQNYQADLHIEWEYAFVGQGELFLSLADKNVLAAPHVVAVLPLLDAQNMELRNGQRELNSTLISLAASGALSGGNAAGKGVLDYINSYQKDAVSRNAMPVVNSYTTGRGMGFRFAPSFVAMADPAKKKSPAANRLIPTSFPVLAVIAMRSEDVKAGSLTSEAIKKAGGYNKLLTHVSHRWLIRDHRISLWPWDWELPKRRDDEIKRLQLTWDADSAYGKLVDQKATLTKLFAGETANGSGSPPTPDQQGRYNWPRRSGATINYCGRTIWNCSRSS